METAIVGVMGILAAGYLARRAYKEMRGGSGCTGCDGCCGCSGHCSKGKL